MYHGVTDAEPANPIGNVYGYNLPVDTFRQQMAYLHEHCNVISAADAVSGVVQRNGRKNVVITFDDGYRNFITNAFPLLMKYNLPALLSLPTSFVFHRKPLWNDALEYAVVRTSKQHIHLQWGNLNRYARLTDSHEKRAFLLWLHEQATRIRQESRSDFIGTIFRALEVDYDADAILTVSDYEPIGINEIKCLVESGLIELASHTSNHYSLVQLQLKNLDQELRISRTEIETSTGVPCRYLCIPGGAYTETVIAKAYDAGFDSVFTSDYSEHSIRKSSKVIGRYCIANHQDAALFEDIIHGGFHTAYYQVVSKIRRSGIE